MSLRPRVPAVPAPDAVRRLVGPMFFGIACAIGVAATLIFALVPADLGLAERAVMGAAFLAFALFSAELLRRSRLPDFPLYGGLFAVSVLALVMAVATSVTLHDGLRSPAIGFNALVLCLLGAVAGLRRGLAFAALCALGVAGLGAAHLSGLLPPPSGHSSVAVLMVIHWLLLGGGVAGGALIARVIDHYLAESAERERRFRELLGIAVDWYWEQDEEFRFTRVTESRAGAAARSPQRMLGRTPWEHTGLGLDDAQLDEHRADLEAHRPFSNLLTTTVDAQGRLRHVALSGEPKFDAAGVFQGFWGVGRDVTAQVRAQQAVAASESRYRTLFARSPSPLVLHRRGTVLDANEAAAKLFGYRDAEAMKGNALLDHLATADLRQTIRERLAAAERLEVGEALPVIDYPMQALDGRPFAVQATAVCVDSVAGPALLTIYVDITARKAAEAALRRSEALLSHLFATSPDCLTLTELDSGRFTLVNDCFLQVSGYRREEVIGRTAEELGIWHQTGERNAFVDAVRRQGSVQGLPLSLRRRDGRRIPMLVSGAGFDFDGQRFLVLAARDVSANEQTRLEVEAILNTVSLAIAFVREQRIVRINARHREMFGWSEDELRSNTLSVLWPEPSEFQRMRRQAVTKLRHRHGYECETQLKRRDGSLFWCLLQAQSVDPSNPIGGGTIWSAEDITERRQTQQALADARDAAEAASRAKSAFLANTSHEIRTPLNGLLGLARLAMQPGLSDPRRQQYLAQIVDSTQSLAGIISDILDLSKVEAGRITLEDVPFGLRDTLAAVHHAYLSLAEGKGLALVLSVADALPQTVRGDPLRVRQILTNLVANAIKFTERGSVRIEATLRGETIRLAVHDTGPGIDEQTQRRLFTPFSQADDSTTRRYGGTGLGLSICRELAQLMGGSVGVNSAPGYGSAFWADLPLPASEPPQQEAGTDTLAPLQGGRVLIAEDNPVNMLIAVAMLEQWGLDVSQAGDGAAAVEAAEAAVAAGRPFDLVLMDVHMPVMSGHAAVRRLRERFDAETLPIIALTAAALTSERDEALAAGMNDFLTKPIDVGRLRATLARWLRRTTAA
ncbi:PAS domain S-box protein [uncultured Piscinibacter sp.]|uniref:PAS domain-containing hybrid sensor histidine kinase/response regulator n=1 Tax=uncultured Piscinibacter sp. TaxID=1131835 RepID=UPI002636BBB6|nr:PAS domain S-box protein [uncultured Piscinibacter sp.]